MLGRVHGLLDGVGPVLDARRIAVPPVLHPRYVAGRVDVWHRLAEAVAHDAVVKGEPAPVEPLRVRNDTDPHHHHVGIDPRAVGQRDSGHARVAEDAGHRHACAKVHAVVAVQGRHHPSKRRTQNRGERHGVEFDNGNGQAARAAGRGNLEADEPGAHDCHTGCAREALAQRDGVVQAPQDEQARPWGYAREGSHSRTRGDDQPVVVEERAVGQSDAPGAKVEGRRTHPESQVEAKRFVSLLPAEEGLLRLPAALEHLFRKRWPVVGGMSFVANQRELAVEASAP